MKKWHVGLALWILSWVPVFPDPYHEQPQPVNFWVWTLREIDELFRGERGIETLLEGVADL